MPFFPFAPNNSQLIDLNDILVACPHKHGNDEPRNSYEFICHPLRIGNDKIMPFTIWFEDVTGTSSLAMFLEDEDFATGFG